MVFLSLFFFSINTLLRGPFRQLFFVTNNIPKEICMPHTHHKSVYVPYVYLWFIFLKSIIFVNTPLHQEPIYSSLGTLSLLLRMHWQEHNTESRRSGGGERSKEITEKGKWGKTGPCLALYMIARLSYFTFSETNVLSVWKGNEKATWTASPKMTHLRSVLYHFKWHLVAP